MVSNGGGDGDGKYGGDMRRKRRTVDPEALQTWMLVVDDDRTGQVALCELPPAQRQCAVTLKGGFNGWLAVGHPVDGSPSVPPDADCTDFLFSTHDRHAGNMEAGTCRPYSIGGIASSRGERDRCADTPSDLFSYSHSV